MLLRFYNTLPDVFISKVLPQITFNDLEVLQKVHKQFHQLITNSIFWHRRLYHQLLISRLPNALCTVESSKTLEKLATEGIIFPIVHKPPKRVISNLNNIEIYYENSAENSTENGILVNSSSRILRFHNTNNLHIRTVMEERIYPESVASVYVEIVFSMDLESKLDRDQPWVFELNDQQFVVENPLRFFITTLQTHSLCNYRPFSSNETKQIKWFTFIPDILCLSKIENSFSMQCSNLNGLSGIQVKQVRLKAKPGNKKFSPGLFSNGESLDENWVVSGSINPIGLVQEFRAVEVIQKLSPGYYLEYPDPADNAQILKLQQTAYLNLNIQFSIMRVGKFKISLRMKILERFHFGKFLAVTYDANSGESPTTQIIEDPNKFFGRKYPIEEWFEWDLCVVQTDVIDSIFNCRIYCQNDRSWKSGLEFSSIKLYTIQ